MTAQELNAISAEAERQTAQYRALTDHHTHTGQVFNHDQPLPPMPNYRGREWEPERQGQAMSEQDKLDDHYEEIAYADDIAEGSEDLIPDDYERHYCAEDGEDWPCATVRAGKETR